jgi:hypothetical protein
VEEGRETEDVAAGAGVSLGSRAGAAAAANDSDDGEQVA